MLFSKFHSGIMNFWHFIKTFFLLSLCINYSTLAAQLQPDSVKQLNEIIVTESSQKNKIRSTSPLQSISGNTLLSITSLQISDALKYFSGVTIKDYGGIGGLKTVSVRSLGANHTAVSYDGIAINDTQTGQIDIGRFSLDNLETIALNNGQSDNIFQPARLFASASVIQLRTKSPTFKENENLNGMFKIKTGSFQLLNPAFSVNYKINPTLKTQISGEWMSSRGDYPYILYYSQNKTDSSSIEKRKNSDVKNLRLEGTLFADFSTKSRGSVKTYFYNSERGLPGATIYYNTTSFSSQRLWDKTFFTQGFFEHQINNQLAVQTKAKYNYGSLKYNDPTVYNVEGNVENNYIQQEYYHSLSFLYRIFSQLSFNFSSDFSWNNLKTNQTDFSNPDRISWLNVLAGKYVNDYFLITGSLLHTAITDKVEIGQKGKNHQKLSPYVSFSIKPFQSEDLHFRFFYKNIFRVPTFNDLYYQRIGNPNLLPENTNQFNGGLTYSTDFDSWLSAIIFTADAYQNQVKNKIVVYPTKNIFEWTMLNYGKVEINGIDGSLDVHFQLKENTRLLIGATHSYQKALNKTSPQNKDYNHQIPYTPRISGSGKIGFEFPTFQFHYSMFWSGHRYTENQNFSENRVEGYSDHNISFSKKWNVTENQVLFLFEITNIFNHNYEIVRSFPMPGRSFRLSLNYNF